MQKPKIKWALIIFVSVCIISATRFWWYFSGPGRYAEYQEILEKIVAIPGARVVKSGGEEDLTFQSIYADIELNGTIISFRNLSLRSFESPTELVISRVGNFVPRLRGCMKLQFSQVRNISDNSLARSRFMSHAVDIGPKSPFPELVDAKFKNLQDTLLRSNELKRIFLNWPDKPHIKYKEEEKRVFSYWILLETSGVPSSPMQDFVKTMKNEDDRSLISETLPDPNWERYCNSIIGA